MAGTPISELLDAVDTLDVENVMALTAPEAAILLTDGRRAEGAEAVRELLGSLLGTLRSATHAIRSEWHLDGVWIAEVDATYELHDGLRTAPLPRAFIVHVGAGGVNEMHVYGAHEHPLDERREVEGGMRLGGRWLPPL